MCWFYWVVSSNPILDTERDLSIYDVYVFACSCAYGNRTNFQLGESPSYSLHIDVKEAISSSLKGIFISNSWKGTLLLKDGGNFRGSHYWEESKFGKDWSMFGAVESLPSWIMCFSRIIVQQLQKLYNSMVVPRGNWHAVLCFIEISDKHIYFTSFIFVSILVLLRLRHDSN